MKKVVLRKYKCGNGFKPCDDNAYDFEDALNDVDNGVASLKAQFDNNGNLKINILYKEDDGFYYACRIPNLNSTREFNEMYGKDYIDNFNFYL